MASVWPSTSVKVNDAVSAPTNPFGSEALTDIRHCFRGYLPEGDAACRKLWTASCRCGYR